MNPFTLCFFLICTVFEEPHQVMIPWIIMDPMTVWCSRVVVMQDGAGDAPVLRPQSGIIIPRIRGLTRQLPFLFDQVFLKINI